MEIQQLESNEPDLCLKGSLKIFPRSMRVFFITFMLSFKKSMDCILMPLKSMTEWLEEFFQLKNSRPILFT